ncbi:MAG: HTTM domain-containing protein [Gemmatimonadota bacterium]
MLMRGRGAWDRFWFHPVDLRGLALARMATALAGLWTAWEYLGILGHLTYPGGVPPEASALWAGRSIMGPLAGLGFLSAPPGPHLLLLALAISLAALGLGYRTALAGGFSWGILFWFQTRNPIVLNGGDEFLRLVLFYLALGHLAIPLRFRRWSVDSLRAGEHIRPGPSRLEAALSAWRNHWHSDAMPPAWPVRLLQLQLVTLYLTSGLWKASGTEWRDGTGLWLALTNPSISRIPVPDTVEIQGLFLVLGLATFAWQLLFPVLVWLPSTRWAILMGGIAFHLFTGVLMQLGPFPAVILASYPAFLFMGSRGEAGGAGEGTSSPGWGIN